MFSMTSTSTTKRPAGTAVAHSFVEVRHAGREQGISLAPAYLNLDWRMPG